MAKENLKDWIVVGISGATCAGKTTLANSLVESLAPVYMFNQDRYFYPDDSPKHVKVPEMDHNNYDVLSSLDMERMYADVVDTLSGCEVKAHRVGAEPAGKRTVAGKKFLILEGFTLLNYRPIFELCTLKYYLVLEREECVRRRQRRTYDPPDVPGYFERCVWPEHERYRRELPPTRAQHVDGAAPPDVLLARVLADVDALAGDVSARAVCSVN